MFCIARNHPGGSCFQLNLEQCSYCANYQSGNHPPQYPVPALRLIVDFHTEEVTMWSAGQSHTGYVVYNAVKVWDNDLHR